MRSSRTSNIVVEPHTQVVEADREERLEALRLRGPRGRSQVPATSLFVFIGAEPGTEWLPASHFAGREGLCAGGAGFAA